MDIQKLSIFIFELIDRSWTHSIQFQCSLGEPWQGNSRLNIWHLTYTQITQDNMLYIHTTHACNPIRRITWTRVQWQQHTQHPCSLPDLGVAFCTSPHTILDDCSSSMASRHGSHSLLGVLPVVLGALMAHSVWPAQSAKEAHPWSGFACQMSGQISSNWCDSGITEPKAQCSSTSTATVWCWTTLVCSVPRQTCSGPSSGVFHTMGQSPGCLHSRWFTFQAWKLLLCDLWELPLCSPGVGSSWEVHRQSGIFVQIGMYTLWLRHAADSFECCCSHGNLLALLKTALSIILVHQTAY